jgi:crotonobetainyl-CoA:carnitine CoA-transferase CaiB-like acyl-CoA transferase
MASQREPFAVPAHRPRGCVSLRWRRPVAGRLTEVPNTEIGEWPVAKVPFDMSETPPYIGGPIDKGAPVYGEHNYEVFAEVLGLSPAEVDQLAEEGVA